MRTANEILDSFVQRTRFLDVYAIIDRAHRFSPQNRRKLGDHARKIYAVKTRGRRLHTYVTSTSNDFAIRAAPAAAPAAGRRGKLRLLRRLIPIRALALIRRRNSWRVIPEAAR